MSHQFSKFQDEEEIDFDVPDDLNGSYNKSSQKQSTSIGNDEDLYDLEGSHQKLDEQNGDGLKYNLKNQNGNRKQSNGIEEFDSFDGQDSDRDGSETDNSEGQQIRNQRKTNDPTVSYALVTILNKLEQPIKYLLAYQISLLVLKISRVILVLGLLFKLFFEMSCQKSSIHSLLLCAFLRDVISGLLDLQFIFKIYEIRYKINRKHYDDQIKAVGKDMIKAKRDALQSSQQFFGRFTQMEAITQIQQAPTYEMFELETAVGNLMPYQAYFMRILKYSYHFLFFISLIFIIRYDDEQFCHVFEKYAIIYLFLPIYVLFLVIALCLTFLGFFCTIILILLLVLLGKYIHGKYQQQKQHKINEFRAKNLGSVAYNTIQNKLNNNQCAVCLNNYQGNEQVTILKCSPQHHFHHSCLQKWILLKGQCPSCRSDRIV